MGIRCKDCKKKSSLNGTFHLKYITDIKYYVDVTVNKVFLT